MTAPRVRLEPPRTATRALRGLATGLRSPADGWLLARMLAWRAVLPALKRGLPLPRLVRLMAAPPSGRGRDHRREASIVDLADRVYGHRRAGNGCLERSLVAYRYLARAEADPALVIGVRHGEGDPRAHAWVVVDGDAIHDAAASLAVFAPVAMFRSDGTLEEGRDARS
ncbi:MAG: lasso peptide biosynthesis B2 protein [Thermoleophilia bacterium]|nr:lasso peptide biosynthesis B2 protein [Thermoleophilia bacterium]